LINLQPGDIVTVEPWDCEGIEPPWGWNPDDSIKMQSGPLPKFKRAKIKPGALGIVVEKGVKVVNMHDENYVIMVSSTTLCIPVRFLNRVE
jgi:hypothetical protein